MPKIQTSNYDAIATAIDAGKDFDTYGSLSGKAGESVWSWGRLPYDLRASVKDADYVIYSYQTPIAWRTQGQWHQPAEKYSVTTSKQQGTVRRALRLLQVTPV